MISFTIFGAPRTKKNSSRIVRPKGKGYPRILPSAAHQEWYRKALPQAKLIKACSWTPIDFPINCRALIYRDALRGDAVGYYQAIADLLEAAGVVSDDKWIVTWDGSRLLKDADQSRVEIEITSAGTVG